MEFDEKILNEEQLQPLKQTEGAVLVTAGAGSGKTRLLTYRVAYLIEEKGVSPYNILAITSNVAICKRDLDIDFSLNVCQNAEKRY